MFEMILKGVGLALFWLLVTFGVGWFLYKGIAFAVRYYYTAKPSNKRQFGHIIRLAREEFEKEQYAPCRKILEDNIRYAGEYEKQIEFIIGDLQDALSLQEEIPKTKEARRKQDTELKAILGLCKEHLNWIHRDLQTLGYDSEE